MQATLYDHTLTPLKRGFVTTIHLLVLAASVMMIVWITRETIDNVSFLSAPGYMRFQFWVCLLFLFDIAVEWLFAPHKLRYVVSNLFFILISIPWLNLIETSGLQLSPQAYYVMRFVPMIRAGYVLALISGALSANKALSMMAVYIIWVIASVYFGSLVFFVEEHYINPLVDSWWSALWWSALNITTVGCEISPMTATGKVLAIILSGEGLILFPVFTVYVTNAVIGSQKSGSQSYDSAQENTPDTTSSQSVTSD